MRIKNHNQIIRLDGRNCFVEALDSAFAIEKVQLNFVSYDDKSNKQTALIPYYLDFTDFMVLEQDILSGRLAKLAETEKAKGAKYPQSIYMQQGGVSAKKLEQRGQKRPDGKSLSRVFKIVPGDKYPFMVQAEQGAGEENDKGLIVSKFGGKPELRVMIPMQSEDTKKFVLMIGAKIRAYMAAQYVYFNKEEYTKQAKEEKDKMDSFRKAN